MDALENSKLKGGKKECNGRNNGEIFAGMRTEEKQEMMEQMMPRKTECVNMMGWMGAGERSGCGMMGMVSQMMSGGQEKGMSMMPHMMTKMMPICLNMMLPNVPKEERVDFVLNMITALMEQGSAGMSEEEKSEFVRKVREKIAS